MISDKTIAEAVTKMVDKPFALADDTKGWDCLNSLNEFYVACGVKFPRAFEDWNEFNYSKRWAEDSVEGRQAFLRFLQSLGKPVNPKYCIRGDLLILQTKNQPLEASRVEKILTGIKGRYPKLLGFISEVLLAKKLYAFPAIYLGNGHIFMVFDRGCRVVPYRFFEKNVIGARRLIP